MLQKGKYSGDKKIPVLNIHKNEAEPLAEPQGAENKKPAENQRVLNLFSGENRIRTCETLLTLTRFPGVPLQPLEHLSIRQKTMTLAKNDDTRQKR